MTALVGASGSGKSTAVKLLEWYYDPKDGAIIVQGQDLWDINLKSYRQHVGYVGQEPVLFNESIRENMCYCKPDATTEELEEALQKANALELIRRLSNGIDTNVGTSGSQLSGGEKQRIALARAFVKRPVLLILDEATSALDRKNESEVQQAIDNLSHGDLKITIVVIAHRLSTIEHADKIIVFEKGNIVEEGDHESLMELEGVYSKLVLK